MEPARANHLTNLEDASPRRQRYLWALLGMLVSATIFEGYDITIFHLCTPDIARDFHLSDTAVGLMATLVRTGGIMSFFVVTLADRVGRKRVIGNTVLCYAFFTLLTALSSGLASFTLFQSISQVFLAAEFGLAVTIICEEFPDEMRGRAISILHTVAFIGVTAAGILYGYVARSSFGWRGMYLLGIAPLLLVAWMRRGMRETTRFTASELTRTTLGLPRASILAPIRQCMGRHSSAYRTRLLLVSALCNCIGLVGGPTISFFSLYAQRDHGWTSGEVGTAFVLAYLMGSAGTLLSGLMLDRVGRRATTSLFYCAAGAAMFTLFRGGSHQRMMLAIMATMFSYQGARAAASAISSELFPTVSRATGYSLTVQVLGQLGWTLAPVIVGRLSVPMGGLGNAASIFALGPFVGALLVLLFVPETRGQSLEQLSPDATSHNVHPG
ncbi:MAG TPA: MFS transporter [Candidatus Binataceae bacterium]|nr:MFS transporter [Candidatus Binataceae bacterium]